MKSRLFIQTILITFLFSNIAYASGITNSLLSGFDNIYTPTEKISLSAKLEKNGTIPYRSDIEGEEVEFYLGDEYLGSSITDFDGIAKLEYKTLKQGQYSFVAKVNKNSRYRSLPAKLFHVVISPKKRIVISDIDHTISDASSWQVLIKPNSKLKPLKNAEKGIHFFEKKGFQIIYLTARDDSFILKTKDWLSMYHFSKAPSFFWDYKGAGIPQDHGDFKSSVILKLKRKFQNILIGIGDKPHDMRAYRDHGLRSYYIGKSNVEIDPDALRVKSWDELVEHILVNPIGTISSDPFVL